MADTGATLPGTGADDDTVGAITWGNPTNIEAEAGFSKTVGFLGGAGVNFHDVKIVKSDGSFGTEDKATGSLTTSQTSYFFGASDDLWSESWDDTDINDIDFGVVVSYFGDNATSHYLKATNFGFSIPSGATIDGIKVEINGEYLNEMGFHSPQIHYIKITVYYTEGVAGVTRKIKISGTFQDKPIKIKVGGTFQDKPIKIKVGGTFQDA